MTVTGNFERFEYLTLKQFFENSKPFPKNYRFLIGSTKIKSATFPYKTDLSEAYVKTERMGIKNGRITKNRIFQ